MKRKLLYRYPFIPQALIILLWTYLHYSSDIAGDEIRYLNYAEDLLNLSINNNIWNGPGYPLFVSLLLLLELGKPAIVIFNALFAIVTLILMHYSIKKNSNELIAFYCGWFFTFYLAICIEIGSILSEFLTMMLITSSILSLNQIFSGYKIKHALIFIFSLTFLMITKVIFGYVALIGLVLALVALFITKQSRYMVIIRCIITTFLLTSPYLYHTYQLTGKMFYWSNAGGMQLYWMTALDKYQYGDWNNLNLNVNCHNSDLPCYTAMWEKEHLAVVETAKTLEAVDRDDFFKLKAIENIKQNPIKYGKNVVSNMGRMLFGVPFSYAYQTFNGLIRIIFSSFLFVLLIISVVIIIRNKYYKIVVLIPLIIFAIYFLGSSLVSAYYRQYYVFSPILIFIIAVILFDNLRLLKHREE